MRGAIVILSSRVQREVQWDNDCNLLPFLLVKKTSCSLLQRER